MSSFKEYLLENPSPAFTMQGGMQQPAYNLPGTQRNAAPVPTQQTTPQPYNPQNNRTNPEWWKSYADVSKRLNSLSFSKPPGTSPTADIMFYKALINNPRRTMMTQKDIAKLALQYKTSPNILD